MKPHILTATIALLASGPTFAQATIKEVGQWRAALTVSAATTSGNTRSSSLSLLGDGVRATLLATCLQDSLRTGTPQPVLLEAVGGTP